MWGKKDVVLVFRFSVKETVKKLAFFLLVNFMCKENAIFFYRLL